VTKLGTSAIRGSLWCACLMLGALSSRTAAQDQFVVADATFTATAQNTMMSQYPIAPLPAAPANWKTPVDFSNGTMYVRYEVLEKPSAASTYGNICFEQGQTLTCQGYPAPYTATGVYMNNAKLSTFWQYSMIDWTKKIDRVYVVLKDDKMAIVQGNAMFYPTKLHVTVTVVAPGKTYVMPTATSDDADADAGTPPAAPMRDGGVAGKGGAAMMTPPKAGQAASAGTTAAAASTAGRGTALTGSAGRSTAGNTSQPSTAGTHAGAADYLDHGSSCSLVSPPRAAGASGTLAMLVSLALLFVARTLRRRAR
jgi:hypothetical protein